MLKDAERTFRVFALFLSGAAAAAASAAAGAAGTFAGLFIFANGAQSKTCSCCDPCDYEKISHNYTVPFCVKGFPS
jgi:hypothetical protein